MSRLSAILVARNPSQRLKLIVSRLRACADELIVAVDDRAGDGGLGALEVDADVVATFEFRDEIERQWEWICSLASEDWIFWLDDDELPSGALLDELPALVAADDVTHYQLRRRWLWPDVGSALDEPPWQSEFVPRLFRRDRAVVWFPGMFHLPVKQIGPFRFVDAPLYHLDLALTSLERRREKVRRYEARRPGLRIGGRPLNQAFYLPEACGERPRTVEVGSPDREALAAVAAASSVPLAGSPPTRAVQRGSREAIDSVYRRGPEVGSSGSGHIELHHPLPRFAAGVEMPVELWVTNESDHWWPPHGFGVPEVQVSYRWHAEDGSVAVDGGLRTPLPAGLAPGAAELVVADVQAPAVEGRYVLAFDLLREHLRWFGREARVPVVVAARPTVGILCGLDDEELAIELAAALTGALPDVSMRLIVGDPAAVQERTGYESVDDPHARSFERGLWRDGPAAAALALHLASPAAESAPDILLVAGSERLGGVRGRREAWRAARSVSAFRAAGASVVLVRRSSSAPLTGTAARVGHPDRQHTWEGDAVDLARLVGAVLEQRALEAAVR